MSPISQWAAPGSAEDSEAAPAWLAFQDAARRYREDEAWRARIDDGETEAVSALMRAIELKAAPDATVRVKANDAGTFHVVLPPDPNMALVDESLSGISGGVRASTIASAGSASTVGCSCMPSTLGSAGCASSAAPD